MQHEMNSTAVVGSRSRRRERILLRSVVLVGLQLQLSVSFLIPVPVQHQTGRNFVSRTETTNHDLRSFSSTTALNVWWFGGTETAEQVGQDEDSCELVPVRIERPASNKRRIFGEIVAPVPIEDVWAILTDYDRLAYHVPNLVESKIMRRQSGGEPGDGSFRCRLFQKVRIEGLVSIVLQQSASAVLVLSNRWLYEILNSCYFSLIFLFFSH